ncbi:hypothetical protein Rumal_0533 [Ruminococcus albus 7 = DSM 20455]|uniref:Uncharacterized protein n=1 Tax=Ruminococcus albus (strain ATCC 27210 / DSM 20455 / JCM 14654 / NCDO 2250 / 7) TaxID=697329 RepID=E6UG56_RUMA7|nr:hypothetical protein Rumal_0533 [Ruminococcus albus 7 = DSM 20455]
MTIKTMSKKKKYIIILAVVVLIVSIVKYILYHGYPFNTPQIIYNAVQINRPQNSENIV